MLINPISYPGNKNKLLKEIIPLFPNNYNSMVDVFCGSGVVGANASCVNLYCNDNNPFTIQVLKYFYGQCSKSIIADMETIIAQYGLTYSRTKPKGFYIEHKHEGLSLYNKQGYNKLKDDYNKDKDIRKLVALLIYGFNHYLRFNADGIFNVPVGKVDFSNSIYNNMISFVDGIKTKSISFSTLDFTDKRLYQDTEAFYYFDPPYSITTAPYNSSWSSQDDEQLFSLIDGLHARNSLFAMSNVMLSNGKENLLLKEWAKKYNTHLLKRQYRNANYQKKNVTDSIEVLITNY